MDSRGAWSTELLTQFIEVYRDNPCLWKVKDKQYLNNNLRNAAYDKLVTICKVAFPKANRDFVSKKIQSLRGSFRKEYKKVQTQVRSGASQEDTYKSSLWYYDLLLFTVDSDISAKSLDNADVQQVEDEEKSLEENLDQSFEDIPESVNDEGPSDILQRKDRRPNQVSFSMPSSSKRRKKESVDDVQKQFMRTCTKALEATSADVGEFEAIGIVVKKKLERMDLEQAMLAENLINTVLLKGLLKQLSRSTIVHNPYPNPPPCTWTSGNFERLHPSPLPNPAAPPFDCYYPTPVPSPAMSSSSNTSVLDDNGSTYTVLN